MQPIFEIADLKRLARRRVPKMFFDYTDSGSWTESTYRANEEDFAKIEFRQRVLVDMSDRSLESSMIGQKVSMPVALAPTGLTGMQHADGEMLAAQAAEAFGVPFMLSTMSICSIEDVASVTKKPFWFQLYVMRDRDFVRYLIDRAKAAKCSALVLTVDLQVLGQRHKDMRNGLSAPPKLRLANILRNGDASRLVPGHGANRAPHVPQHRRPRQGRLRSGFARELDRRAVRSDAIVERCRMDQAALGRAFDHQGHSRCRGRQAGGRDSGADALIVSNHGGRQLDCAPSSISMLPSIAEAVGDRIEVHFDGGIRSGQDVLKAIALGAKGTYIGRSFLYGLCALGRQGVTLALEIIRKELDVTLGLCGKRVLRDVGRDILRGDV